jgi:hypothetical protein
MLKDRNIQAESGSRSATTEWGNMEGKYVAYSLQPESRLPNSVWSRVNLYIGPDDMEERYVEHPCWRIIQKGLKIFSQPTCFYEYVY